MLNSLVGVGVTMMRVLVVVDGARKRVRAQPNAVAVVRGGVVSGRAAARRMPVFGAVRFAHGFAFGWARLAVAVVVLVLAEVLSLVAHAAARASPHVAS